MGYADIVKLLLERGAPVNERDADGFTRLMHAAAAIDDGNTTIIEMLLAADADTQARTPTGETPRALAARYGKASADAALHVSDLNVRSGAVSTWLSSI